MNWYLEAWKRWQDYSGRARRTEFWIFVAVNAVASSVLWFFDVGIGFMGSLSALYSLVVLLPALAVTVRRLHDSGHEGLWVVAGFVPLLNLVLLYFLVLDSEPGPNRFGPNPKGL